MTYTDLIFCQDQSKKKKKNLRKIQIVITSNSFHSTKVQEKLSDTFVHQNNLWIVTAKINIFCETLKERLFSRGSSSNTKMYDS